MKNNIIKNEEIKTKVCYKCKKELTLDKFGRAKVNKDGLKGICKECEKENAKKYKPKKKLDIIKEGMKICKKCGKELSLDNFNKNKKDGLLPNCKECEKESRRASEKKYYDNNKEKFRKIRQENRSDNATNKELEVNFPQEILNYKLNTTEKEKIAYEVSKKFKKSMNLFKLAENCGGINYVFENIYKMLIIFKYTTGEVTECFNRNNRTIEVWLRKMNWNLDKFDAQQRVADRGRRNYKEIRNKSKQTMISQAYISKPEEYARQKLNTYLPIIFNNAEIIVGLNNTSILENGKEIDIPIIILYKEKIYKFAIEYNGHFWHENSKESDDIKQKLINDKGYKLYYLYEKINLTPKQIQEYINEQIEIICTDIQKILNKIE